MNIVNTIFRAYDIRGITGSEITEQTAELIGHALGKIAKREGQTQFCVGYDGRHSSPMLAQGLHAGLMASGMDVVDVGTVATPLLYFATVHYRTGSGVMITGSHNPAEYNGFKIMVAGKALALEEITEIYNLITEGGLLEGNSQERGKLQQLDVSQDYIKAILKQDEQHGNKKIKVVVDAGNGATAEIAPLVFKALGYDVVPLFCQIDGNFPNHHPDPGKPENMVDLQAAVAEHEADIGIAFDGDGDRLGIVTEQGEMIYPDKAMMLFAEDMLERNPGAQVIVDVKSSPLLVKHIEKSGGKALVWKTGHSLIKRKMKESGALLAGEMSGHIFFAEDWYGFDDALLASARMLSIIAKMDKPVSQVFSAYESWQGTPEINLATTDSTKSSIVQKLIEEGDFGEAKKVLTDGIRVEYERCWGLMRCSNTTPTLVLRFEGQNKKDLKNVINVFSRELNRLVPEVNQGALLGYALE